MAKQQISFKDYAASNYGEVYRSSAIFYYVSNNRTKTTISFLNYWKFKRGLNVAVVASVRDMSGRLYLRERLDFNRGEVINYRPSSTDGGFEGSIEIEVFSSTNLRIPYAAVVAVYETQRGVTLVHSYARAYSPHEIEEGRTIMQGEEACWTIRDSGTLRSFCVVHNGNLRQPAQMVTLTVTNHEGKTRTANLNWPELNPYESVKIYPADKIDGLIDFLKGDDGFGSMSFQLSGFTRMLVGNEARDDADLQVTHSNFNYQRHETDSVEGADGAGYMCVPDCGVEKKEVVVYPEASNGSYRVNYSKGLVEFRSGQGLKIPVPPMGSDVLKFERVGGNFPTRLVTALLFRPLREGLIPNECSLGILTKLQPAKRMWWGACVSGNGLQGKLVIHDFPEVFGKMSADQAITVRLFSSVQQNYLERVYPPSDLSAFSKSVAFENMFSNAEQFLGGDMGYFTVFSEYPGLTCYSMSENRQGSMCLEHGF